MLEKKAIIDTASPSPEEIAFVRQVRHDGVRYGGAIFALFSVAGGVLVFANEDMTVPGVRTHGILALVSGFIALLTIWWYWNKERWAAYSLTLLNFLLALGFVPFLYGYYVVKHGDDRPFILFLLGYSIACLSVRWCLGVMVVMTSSFCIGIWLLDVPLPAFDAFYVLLAVPGFSFIICIIAVRVLSGVFQLQNRVRIREQELVLAQQNLRDEQAKRKLAEERKKESEAEVARQQEQLLHISRVNAMGEMVAGIAHEINQPLSAISMQAGVLKHPKTSAEDKSTATSEIGRLSNRCGEIIRRLQGFVRRKTSGKTVFDMKQLIHDSIALTRSEQRKHKIVLDYGSVEAVQVAADEVQIQQVMVNLLRNAYDSMAGIEGERKTVVTCEVIGKLVTVRVVDNGMAMSPEQLANAFEAFYTTKTESLGMGLAISRTIVERYGGNIAATRNALGGMTFEFTLPKGPTP